MRVKYEKDDFCDKVKYLTVILKYNISFIYTAHACNTVQPQSEKTKNFFREALKVSSNLEAVP